MRWLVLLMCLAFVPAWACEVGEITGEPYKGRKGGSIKVTQPVATETTSSTANFETTVTFRGWEYVDIWFWYFPTWGESYTEKKRLFRKGNDTCTFSQVGKEIYENKLGQVKVEGVLPDGTGFRSLTGTFNTKP